MSLDLDLDLWALVPLVFRLEVTSRRRLGGDWLLVEVFNTREYNTCGVPLVSSALAGGQSLEWLPQTE